MMAAIPILCIAVCVCMFYFANQAIDRKYESDPAYANQREIELELKVGIFTTKLTSILSACFFRALLPLMPMSKADGPPAPPAPHDNGLQLF